MNCLKHPDTKLICPKCVGSRGGRKRARMVTKKELSDWGKQGGRPAKPDNAEYCDCGYLEKDHTEDHWCKKFVHKP